MEENLIFSGQPLLTKEAIRQINPQTLSFIGDAVFELVVRTKTLREGRRPVARLHEEKKDIVNAAAQAAMIARIGPMLTEEERAVVRSGRNAKQHSKAKNQTVRDYHEASGLEALCGYLYLTGQTARLEELLRAGISGAETDGAYVLTEDT